MFSIGSQNWKRSALLSWKKHGEEELLAIHGSIERLERMGYHYSIVEENASAPLNGTGKLNGKTAKPRQTRAGRSGKGTRRAGIRQEVLSAIAKSGKKGMTRGELIAQFKAKDHSFKQSISNALAALKKQKQVKAASGVYRTTARSQ